MSKAIGLLFGHTKFNSTSGERHVVSGRQRDTGSRVQDSQCDCTVVMGGGGSNWCRTALFGGAGCDDDIVVERDLDCVSIHQYRLDIEEDLFL